MQGNIGLPPKGTKSGCHDLGMLGVLLHVIGDAVNNLGVMVAALIIWFTKFEGRYYADPAASLWIACIIILSSVPLRVLFSICGVESGADAFSAENRVHPLGMYTLWR
jgi:zinc transporter 1